MPGHSSVLQVLGTFILWMGWYGPGSTLGIAPAGYAMRALVARLQAAAAGGVTAVALGRDGRHSGCRPRVQRHPRRPRLDHRRLLDDDVRLSLLTGVLGGGVYFGSSKLVLKLGIDDPLDAFAVHGSVPSGASSPSASSRRPTTGTTSRAPPASSTAATSRASSSACSSPASSRRSPFGYVAHPRPLKAARILRVDAATEEEGMDVSSTAVSRTSPRRPVAA